MYRFIGQVYCSGIVFRFSFHVYCSGLMFSYIVQLYCSSLLFRFSVQSCCLHLFQRSRTHLTCKPLVLVENVLVLTFHVTLCVLGDHTCAVLLVGGPLVNKQRRVRRSSIQDDPVLRVERRDRKEREEPRVKFFWKKMRGNTVVFLK